jgi:DNA-binding NtrC family response regulator
MVTNPIRILLVDDDASLLRAFDRTFGRKYTIKGVGSGTAALTALREAEFDVAIVDYSMPGMNGIELLELMAQGWPSVARLTLTAYSDLPEVVALKARKLVTAVLTKPWERAEVEAAVLKAVQLASMHRAVEAMKTQIGTAD